MLGLNSNSNEVNMAGKKGGSGGMFKSMGKGQAGNTSHGAKKGGKKK